jgi:hypothetical protein
MADMFQHKSNSAARRAAQQADYADRQAKKTREKEAKLKQAEGARVAALSGRDGRGQGGATLFASQLGVGGADTLGGTRRA